MAITGLAVTLTVAPAQQPCNAGGVFTGTAVVTGTASLGSDQDRVSLYDHDGWWDKDELLTQTGWTTVPGTGLFTQTSILTLVCDTEACTVRGSHGDSGESTAEVYAYVEERGLMFAATAESAVVPVTCTTETACLFVPRGGTAVAGRFTFSVPAGAVKTPTEVKVAFPAPAPLTQRYPETAGDDLVIASVGADSLRLAKEIAVSWKLTPRMLAKLKQAEGMLLRYDRKTGQWRPVENWRLRGAFLKFTIRQGGRYAVASHRKYRWPCGRLIPKKTLGTAERVPRGRN